jgi:hypothetical protein
VDDILRALGDHLGLVIIIVVWIMASFSKALKPSRRMTTSVPGLTQTQAKPADPPQAARPPTQFTARQSTQGKARTPSNSEQLAQKRAGSERFPQKEKERQTSELAALGMPISSAISGESAQSDPFGMNAAISEKGVPDNLLRAIILAQALGPPRAKGRRMRRQPPRADD